MPETMPAPGASPLYMFQAASGLSSRNAVARCKLAARAVTLHLLFAAAGADRGERGVKLLDQLAHALPVAAELRVGCVDGSSQRRYWGAVQESGGRCFGSFVGYRHLRALAGIRLQNQLSTGGFVGCGLRGLE